MNITEYYIISGIVWNGLVNRFRVYDYSTLKRQSKLPKKLVGNNGKFNPLFNSEHLGMGGSLENHVDCRRLSFLSPQRPYYEFKMFLKGVKNSSLLVNMVCE